MMATGLGTAIAAVSSTAATIHAAVTLIIIATVTGRAVAAITADGAATGIAILVTATDTATVIGAVDTIRGGDILGTPMATGMNRRTVITGGTAIGK